MSNENPGNTSGWRNKVDGLEHLPGSVFNSDAAWDKLHRRLQGNKSKKKTFLYWSIAACLLLVLMISILNYPKNKPQVSNKDTVKEQSKKINTPGVKVKEADKNENKNNSDIVEGKMIPTLNKPAQRNRRIIKIETATKVRHNDVSINAQEQEPVVKPLQIINNSTTSVFPQKKKLKVVHINELGDPMAEPWDVTRVEDTHSFRLKFANGEVFSNSPSASKPPGLIILKTKTVSN
jgi:hypothetical protein